MQTINALVKTRHKNATQPTFWVGHGTPGPPCSAPGGVRFIYLL